MKSHAFDRLLATFDEVHAEFQCSPAMQFMASDEFSLAHYASVLREIYFYTRENPQLQCAMTLGFRGPQREAVRRIVGHALDEIGHDRLALDDLETLGYDVSGIPSEEPLPSTVPLIAYPVYLLNQRNPASYLGQIFFLEFLPTRSGPAYLERIRQVGVPEKATTFLAEHAAVDEHHNRLMQKHVSDLLLTETDVRDAETVIRTSGHLYASMLTGAFANAEKLTKGSGSEEACHAS